jgi:hypothetical protein
MIKENLSTVLILPDYAQGSLSYDGYKNDIRPHVDKHFIVPEGPDARIFGNISQQI